MNILDISIITFILMELSNVLILYFKPKFKYGNGIAVFDDYQIAENDKSMFLFVNYLKNWVANVKLIFIVLLFVILIKGDDELKVLSLIVLIASIFVYYISLHPIIKQLDKMGKISPEGYSKTLFWMITGFILMFTAALIIHLVMVV